MTTDVDPDRRNILLAGTALAITSVLAGGATFVASAEASSLNPQPLPPSPEWARALPPGPDARVKITEEYARHVARDVYFWAWPMANIYNRRLAFKDVTEIMMSGPAPIAPLNRVGISATRSAARQLAARAEKRFLAYVRAYWPKAEVLDGSWTPPPVQRVS
jgi:hypothetical protein